MKKTVVLSLILLSAGIIVYFFIPHFEKKLNIKVLFINQVRGTECCQKGSLASTKKQLELFKKHAIPATFVLRYDAITDNQFISLLKSYGGSQFDYGIFFEITPLLARDAGVVYRGTEERWYRAQYAYLVGYSQEERKKIIDTAMIAFKKQFGVYPKTTGGWMIDTFSANYLSSDYGVESHELTREQWGTDGYALYGGSISSVYVPSKNWLFTPAKTEKNTLNLRILRQTVSDPVRNYGDLTSSYTSQPNDYGRTKSFDYFKHLIRQVEGYSEPLAILGLENSLNEKYQETYQKQIQYIISVVDKKNIILPKNITGIETDNYAIGADFTNKQYKAFWIETSSYRARFIQKNNYVQLTDLRIFDELVKDPYYELSSGAKTAFWEAPFVFDSSKNGVHKTISSLTIKTGELFRFFGNEDWIRERANPVVNEQFLSEINGIIFPQLKKNSEVQLSKKDNKITLQYTKTNGGAVIFTFDEKGFLVRGLEGGEYEMHGSVGPGTQLELSKKDNGYYFSPVLVSITPTISEQVTTDNRITTTTTVRQGEVNVIYNAPRSIMGRNPVRLVIVSKDTGGRPLRLNNLQIYPLQGSFYTTKIHETEGHLGEFDGMYYIDIEANVSGTYTPILSYDFEKKELNPITFVIDCKSNLKTCLLSPQMTLEYVKVKIEDVMQRR